MADNYLQMQILEIDTDVKESADRRQFYVFLLRACHYVGGRITVAVDKPEGAAKERLLAAALWLPPRKRLAAWMLPTMLKSGMFSVLKGWGWTGFVVRTISCPSCTSVDQLLLPSE